MFIQKDPITALRQTMMRLIRRLLHRGLRLFEAPLAIWLPVKRPHTSIGTLLTCGVYFPLILNAATLEDVQKQLLAPPDFAKLEVLRSRIVFSDANQVATNAEHLLIRRAQNSVYTQYLNSGSKPDTIPGNYSGSFEGIPWKIAGLKFRENITPDNVAGMPVTHLVEDRFASYEIKLGLTGVKPESLTFDGDRFSGEMDLGIRIQGHFETDTNGNVVGCQYSLVAPKSTAPLDQIVHLRYAFWPSLPDVPALPKRMQVYKYYKSLRVFPNDYTNLPDEVSVVLDYLPFDPSMHKQLLNPSRFGLTNGREYSMVSNGIVFYKDDRGNLVRMPPVSELLRSEIPRADRLHVIARTVGIVMILASTAAFLLLIRKQINLNK